MSRKDRYSVTQYKKYAIRAYILESEYFEDLSEYDQAFVKNISKKIGFLSDKQMKLLDKILQEYFD